MRKRKGGKFSENKYCWYAGKKKGTRAMVYLNTTFRLK